MHVQGNNVVTHITGDDAIVNSYSIVLAGEPNGGRRSASSPPATISGR